MTKKALYIGITKANLNGSLFEIIIFSLFLILSLYSIINMTFISKTFAFKLVVFESMPYFILSIQQYVDCPWTLVLAVNHLDGGISMNKQEPARASFTEDVLEI